MPANNNLYQQKELFNRIASGDIAAFSQLYREYYAHLYTIVIVYSKNKEMAADTVQEIFLKIWERRAELINIDDPAAWMNTAARYNIKNALYKEFSREEFLKRFTNSQEADYGTPDLITIKQQKEIIQKTVEALPPRQLEVYRLCREEGLSYTEIAGQLGISRETVKEHMARALKFLHAALLKQKDLFILIFFYFFQNNS